MTNKKTIIKYKVLDVRDRQETEMILNEYGKNGYEVICSIPKANRESFIVLKKKIKELINRKQRN